MRQSNLFEFEDVPGAYQPRRPDCLTPETIILAEGSRSHASLIDRIAHLYPAAEIVERFDLSHARITLDDPLLLNRHRAGKKTLVFGTLKSAVRFSEESNNTCPNYWHFSPYGFCPYGCHYCYLAGTIGGKFSPTVKIFLNLPETLHKIDMIARKASQPTSFYIGKLQDGLALDPLTGFSRIMIPFFAAHPLARLIVLTKSADVANLLDLDHAGHTILSWSLNPPQVSEAFEPNTPSIEARLRAMEQCAAAGYPVRAVLMPIIPVPDWPDIYRNFLTHLLHRVPLARLTLGGICSYTSARALMNAKLSADNVINRHLAEKSPDGRMRYAPETRIEMYSLLISHIRSLQPSLPLALCLESPDVRSAVGLDHHARCNCIL